MIRVYDIDTRMRQSLAADRAVEERLREQRRAIRQRERERMAVREVVVWWCIGLMLLAAIVLTICGF